MWGAGVMADRTRQSSPSHLREFIFLLSPQICPPAALARRHAARPPRGRGERRGISSSGDVPHRTRGSRQAVQMGMHPLV